MAVVSSWGRLNSDQHKIHIITHEQLQQFSNLKDQGIAYGMGRSYGDVCLNPGKILWNLNHLDRFIYFDSTNGILKCEAGVLLADIQHYMIPQGWMLPVTPGTQYITVGGAIANDVHGKNHHRFGSFGDHVLEIELLRTDGHKILCNRREQNDWLAATTGGMGLTGIILNAQLQLRPIPGPWLINEVIPYQNLKEFFALADDSENSWEYTVSWLDCYSKFKGRGLLMRANHYEHNEYYPEKKKLNIPITFPFSVINRFTLNPMNSFYYYLKKYSGKTKISHYQSFLYPLDNINNWNRLYGPKGFYQYQCVLPRADGEEALNTMLQIISNSKQGSFLNVLKTFGDRSTVGMMSFPQPGITLALDFPNKGKSTLKLFEQLDKIVETAKGRLYMAKDARMPKALFELGYPRLKEFMLYRDPGISSALSRRLMGA